MVEYGSSAFMFPHYATLTIPIMWLYIKCLVILLTIMYLWPLPPHYREMQSKPLLHENKELSILNLLSIVCLHLNVGKDCQVVQGYFVAKGSQRKPGAVLDSLGSVNRKIRSNSSFSSDYSLHTISSFQIG